MSDDNNKRRKVVLPPKKATQLDVNVVPTLEALMGDAMAIIGSELAKYRSKTNRGLSLDLKEARVISSYMDALVKLSREDRERARAEDLTNLSDEELKELAKEVLKLDFSKESE